MNRIRRVFAFLCTAILLQGAPVSLLQAEQYPGGYQMPPPGGWEARIEAEEKRLGKKNANQQAGTQSAKRAQTAKPPAPASPLPGKRPDGQKAYRAPSAGMPAYGNTRDWRRPSRYGRNDSRYGRSPGYRSSRDDRRNKRSSWWRDSMPWDDSNRRGKRSGKDRFADSWDDMLNAPSDMGEMPGGWYAPSVSAPNPVDVGDEFSNAAQDAPDQMHNVYEDNRRNNSRYRR